MADLRARTSGFESKSIGSGRGGGMAAAAAVGGWEVWVRMGRSAAKGAGGSGRRAGGRVGVMGLMGGRAGDDEREERGGVCAGRFVAPAAEVVAPAAAAAADVAGAGASDVRGETDPVDIVRPGMVDEAGGSQRVVF